MFFSESSKLKNPIYVSRPSLPPLEDYVAMLRPLWESRQLTNHGVYVRRFEDEIREFCGVESCRMVSSGTTALILAIKALGVGGKVVVTPFTFVATTEALQWTGCQPVFADLEPGGWNLDPARIEAAITPDIEAILGVHLFGYPCHPEALKRIAVRHGLALIFDSAHSIACRYRNLPLASHGDASILSFHATKPLTSAEGGAVLSNSVKTGQQVELLRDFGFDPDDRVIVSGLNGKMNEFEAAMGLLQLHRLETEISARKKIHEIYRKALESLPGLSLGEAPEDCDYNFAYAPLRIRKSEFGTSRDAVFEMLRRHNIYSRKYFQPLNSELPWYRGNESARAENLPEAHAAAEETLCLPLYGELPGDTARQVTELIRRFHSSL